MFTYEEKKALVLEIDNIRNREMTEYESNRGIMKRYEKKGKNAAWRKWDAYTTQSLLKWGAYHEMRDLVVHRLFDCPLEDVSRIVRELREEQVS
ncbi:MAG: hypothetical protein EBT13_00400 [Rhodobacteraceae bacterium]|nr:hypothetical protein [Paracoccaceae bacterium]